MGITTGSTKGHAAAIPFLKRALELDPNFAVAYAALGVEYSNLGQARDRVSEREKYRIAALYYGFVGEQEQATQTFRAIPQG